MRKQQRSEVKLSMTAPIKNAQNQIQESLIDFMRRSPMYDSDDLPFERDKSSTREVPI